MTTFSLVRLIDELPGRKWAKLYGALREAGALGRPAALQVLHEYMESLSKKHPDRARLEALIEAARA